MVRYSVYGLMITIFYTTDDLEQTRERAVNVNPYFTHMVVYVYVGGTSLAQAMYVYTLPNIKMFSIIVFQPIFAIFVITAIIISY